MILYLVGTISQYNVSVPMQIVEAGKLPTNSAIDVYINSPGGRIDMAFELGRNLANLNATCYVKYAASAAFELVMPACKKIVYTNTSKVVFHSAMWCSQGMKDTADFLTEFREGLKISGVMNALMTNYWGPATCKPDFKKQYSDVAAPCGVLHMLNETELNAQEFINTFPKVAPIVAIVPKEMFPDIPNPVVEKTDKPTTSNSCEAF